MAENWCFSGGAIGSDIAWGERAKAEGHKVCHLSFEGHKTQASSLKILSQEELIVADRSLQIANSTLKRKRPSSEYTLSLLRRNYYQVRNVATCYAISETDTKMMVKGGTAWAVQMFIDRFDQEACECYLLVQSEKLWYKWGSFGWEGIETHLIPAPKGLYAGIGTRQLLPTGKESIDELYRIGKQGSASGTYNPHYS